MTMATAARKPICANCTSRQVYTLANGTVVCRVCGYRYRGDPRQPDDEDGADTQGTLNE